MTGGILIMLKKSKSFLIVLLTLSMAASIMAGCGKKEPVVTTPISPAPTESSYPLKTDATLKYWVSFTPAASINVKNMSELPYYKELEKKTGVKIEFIHPTSNEQFNLMLASGDLPDVIEYNWYGFAGGPEKAIGDGHIIKLNDAFSKYSPNLTKYLKANPEVDKMVKTDNSSYYVYPFIRGDETLMVYQGPMVRKDWLDELGLKAPTTIDEWENVLKQFKDKKGATAPLSFAPGLGSTSASFVGAYGVREGLYIENGKVKFGQTEAGYKQFLTLFRRWYSEGLLDKNFATVDGKAHTANILDGKTGGTIGNNGGGLGAWTTTGRQKDPKFTLVATPYPTLKTGETPKHGQWDLAFHNVGMVGITSKCKNVEIAARWLDYGYSDEGRMLFNFGVEGESYKMVNGYPTYTETVTKNPAGASMGDMMQKYTRTGFGPTIQDKRYMEQFAALPEQKEALKIWAKTDAAKHILPRLTLTPEESSEAASIINDVNTYVNEMKLKFIMGAEPIENFDKFVEQIKKLGMEKYLGLYQKALDRYSKR
jgi:putative aldouronate transport system substrate-binding protein